MGCSNKILASPPNVCGIYQHMTFNELMIKIDNCTDIDEIVPLKEYFYLYKKRYSLVQVNFAHEYITDKVKELFRCDIIIHL